MPFLIRIKSFLAKFDSEHEIFDAAKKRFGILFPWEVKDWQLLQYGSKIDLRIINQKNEFIWIGFLSATLRVFFPSPIQISSERKSEGNKVSTRMNTEREISIYFISWCRLVLWWRDGEILWFFCWRFAREFFLWLTF